MGWALEKETAEVEALSDVANEKQVARFLALKA
jgi:hypothetical protein